MLSRGNRMVQLALQSPPKPPPDKGTSVNEGNLAEISGKIEEPNPASAQSFFNKLSATVGTSAGLGIPSTVSIDLQDAPEIQRTIEDPKFSSEQPSLTETRDLTQGVLSSISVYAENMPQASQDIALVTENQNSLIRECLETSEDCELLQEITCPVIGIEDIGKISSFEWTAADSLMDILRDSSQKVLTDRQVCQEDTDEQRRTDLTCILVENQTDDRQIIVHKSEKPGSTSKKSFNRKEQDHSKSNRVKGKEYLGMEKKSFVINKAARKMKQRCNHKDLVKFTNRSFLCIKISEDERQDLFETFWKIPTWGEKRAFVRGLVNTREVIRRRRKLEADNVKHLKKSRGNDIYLGKANGERIRVCRTFFINTLDIGEDCFKRWTKKDENCLNEGSSEDDCEGFTKVNASNMKMNRKQKKIKDQENLKKWLDILPKVPSHYCRKSSSRIYVESTFLSKSNMYRVYQDWCKEKQIVACCKTVFMETLDEENIAIHLPRKDQCDTCCGYELGHIKEEEYQAHMLRKRKAKEIKDTYKNEASNENIVITMDLQSVLLCPKLLASKVYYKQKLQVHNFTIYNLYNHNVTLYVWHDVNGGVSANEFTSCIIDFIESSSECQKITLISDGCNYQNRNKVLASALSDIARARKITVEQLFLEKGHTMMECDSIHSSLEHYFTPPINSPSDYVARMRQARPKNPYQIKNIDFSFFKNFEGQKSNLLSLRPGKKCGEPVVTDISQLQYLSDGTIKYKLHHTGEWDVLPQRRRMSAPFENIKQLYQEQLPITQSKFNHLQELKSLIERDHHAFYDSLPTKADKQKE